jgi:hypothetical protein
LILAKIIGETPAQHVAVERGELDIFHKPWEWAKKLRRRGEQYRVLHILWKWGIEELI